LKNETQKQTVRTLGFAITSSNLPLTDLEAKVSIEECQANRWFVAKSGDSAENALKVNNLSLGVK
jgi:hypothetical protein